MPILFRTKGKSSWESAGGLPYVIEGQMQGMLYESPSLIPVSGGEKLARAFIREAGLPGSGRTDLVGVDETGNVYIVECKLATNDEIRRKVIGQVFEYAAYLWEWSFEQFDELFQIRENKSLRQLFADKETSEDWAYDEFRETIAKNLKMGSFHLLIAVDKIVPELKRTIEYSNRPGSGAQLQVIELSLYGKDELEILVPELYPHASSVPSGRGHPPDPPLTQLLDLRRRGVF
jgi:hypothetical protein